MKPKFDRSRIDNSLKVLGAEGNPPLLTQVTSTSRKVTVEETKTITTSAVQSPPVPTPTAPLSCEAEISAVWQGDWVEDVKDNKLPIPEATIHRAIHCLFNPRFTGCNQWYKSQVLTTRFVKKFGGRLTEDVPPTYRVEDHPWKAPHVPKPDDNCKKCLGIGWKDRRIPNSLVSERAFCDCWK